ncbi:MAG: ABC transporter permease [Bacteroidota bacterium]|nr:ABC transporter permease [Bacteroidota bacterium]
MIKSYFKTAWRNITRNKLTAFINVFGLAIGLSCSLLIWLWVSDELSYNRFLPGVKDIYEVHVNAPFNGDTITMTASPGPLAEALQNNIPQIEQATKMTYDRDVLFTVGAKSLKEKGTYATAGFFKVFPLKTIAGNPNEAIASIDQIVITRKIAQKYFNGSGAVGKTIRIDNKKDYRVGAVIEDIPHNSTIQFDWMINFKAQEQDWMKTWGNISFFTYVRLRPHVDLSSTVRNLRTIYPKFASEGFRPNYPTLQAITDVYLYADYKNGKPTGSGRIEYVKIFAAIAIFILLIACMNFMNLATARASLRAKEIGIRKVAGARKASLVGQFMTESLFTCVLATLLSIAITTLLLPAFNHLFDKQIQLNFSQPALWCSIIVLVTVTSVIAGSYPSLFLASFKPVRILKGNAGTQSSNTASVRKALVIVQFALSAFLIVGMLAVSKQVNYIQHKNLGFDKEHIIYLPLDGDLYKRIDAYQNELNKLSYVQASDPINTLPMDLNSTSGDLSWPGKPADLQTETVATSTGYGFAKTLGITMAEGRDFSKDYPGDSLSYVINESAAKMMGMQNGAVGKQVKFWNGNGRIIGVMKDFHMASLHTAIKPLILCLAPSNTSYMMIRLHAGQTKEAIAAISKITASFNPAYPFEYHFADETYEQMYKSEMQVSALVKYFGILAAVISCLGLFGMIAFSAERRTREIGIRKVLGSSVLGIVRLLSVESLKTIIISMTIAFPLAYWAMNEWLASFAYKSSGGIWIFIVTASVMLMVSCVTIGFQAIKAAMANPVKSLRTE